jgi:hypothetical protein
MNQRPNTVHTRIIEEVIKHMNIKDGEIRKNSSLSLDKFEELKWIRTGKYSKLRLDLYFWILIGQEDKI